MDLLFLNNFRQNVAVAQKIYEEISIHVPEAIIETKVGAEGEKIILSLETFSSEKLTRFIILFKNIIDLVIYENYILL